jgi:hypothetical protein
VGGRGREYVLTAVSSSASSNFLQFAWFFDFICSAATWVSEWQSLPLHLLCFSFFYFGFWFCFWFFLYSDSDSSSDSFTVCFWFFFIFFYFLLLSLLLMIFFFAFWFWFFFWFFLYSAFDPSHMVNRHLQAHIIITVDSFIHSNRNIHIHMGEILFSGWLPLWVPTS